MGKVRKTHVEGHTTEARIETRQQLGSLRSLTVQPKTRHRYDKALDKFWAFLRSEHITLPTRAQALDSVLSEYIEHLWSSGAGRALASDTVAALQDAEPHVRHQLQGTWRLLRAWNQNEIPNRAPPLPLDVLKAMVGFSFFREDLAFGLSLLLGFYGVLRTGEILGLRSKDITIEKVTGPAIISLGLTKGGKRSGSAESVSITTDQPLRWLWAWKQQVTGNSLLCASPAAWRKQFNDTLEALQFDDCNFRPYSLRRGGATFWFQKWGSLDRLMLLGRWHAVKTARIYVNEGLAILAELTLPWNPNNRQYSRIFTQSCTQPLPSLEPTKGKSGGRGKVQKKHGKVLKKQLKRTRKKWVDGSCHSPVWRGRKRNPGPLAGTHLGQARVLLGGTL